MEGVMNIYQIPWLIASGITFILALLIMFWIVFKTKDEENIANLKKTSLGQKILMILLISFVPSFLCLFVGLFFSNSPGKQSQIMPTVTQPVFEFSGKLLLDGFTEVLPKGNELTYIEHNIPISGIPAPIIISADGTLLLTTNGITGTVINTETWQFQETSIDVNENSVFSPDSKFLATGLGNKIMVEDVSTGKVIELFVSKCKDYGIGIVGLTSVCLGVGNPTWVDSNTILFSHSPGLFDPKFVFPEEVSITLDDNKEILWEDDGKITETIMTLSGEILFQEIISISSSQNECSGDAIYWRSRIDLAKGDFKVRCVPIAGDIQNNTALWYGNRPEIINTVIKDQNPLLSPDKKYVLIPPNILIELNDGDVIDINGSKPIDREHYFTSCFWHPDSEHYACTYSVGMPDGSNADNNFIRIYSLQSRSYLDYHTDNSNKLIAWLK